MGLCRVVSIRFCFWAVVATLPRCSNTLSCPWCLRCSMLLERMCELTHRYPVVRLAIAASPLQLHLSPYRYQQLMTVLQSAMATPESGAAAAAEANTSGSAAAGSGGTSDKPLWLSEAEHTAKVCACVFAFGRVWTFGALKKAGARSAEAVGVAGCVTSTLHYH